MTNATFPARILIMTKFTLLFFALVLHLTIGTANPELNLLCRINHDVVHCETADRIEIAHSS